MNHIITHYKTHWRIYAMGLFLICVGVMCGNQLSTRLSETQKQQLYNKAHITSVVQGAFMYILWKRTLFFAMQSVFLLHPFGAFFSAGMEIGCIAWRLLCWQRLWKDLSIWSGLLWRMAYGIALVAEAVRCFLVMQCVMVYYKKQRKELYIPKTAIDIRRESLGLLGAMGKVYLCFLPIWCVEIWLWLG